MPTRVRKSGVRLGALRGCRALKGKRFFKGFNVVETGLHLSAAGWISPASK
jgi:hypothetical protein